MKLTTVIVTFIALMSVLSAQAGIRVVDCVADDITVDGVTDLHITATDAIAGGSVVNLIGDDCRLFFDNIRPSDVISRYSGSVRVNGDVLEPDVNARISVYRHGTEILPHSSSFSPLEAFVSPACVGKAVSFKPGLYYSNAPSADVDADNISSLSIDNAMRSFILRRGYMATLATNPDGTGYSRCFIADENDLRVEALPAELDGKVSFIRVFAWQQPSKKGWVGGNGKTNPPEGYLEAQSDATGSTWVYNWGASADWGRSPKVKGTPWRNQEFVPEKWGHGGDSDWKKIANNSAYTHLLSYNEPDHGEQSNVSVDRAIAEWPRHLQTGLRLGSPATTDFAWLHRFMDECDKRNYRVDYVAIHAYWGGSGSAVQVSSVKDWYRKLKEIHEKTGRPIWITEWNNGANWTHEAWPSDKAEQQEKQRKFMEEVLAMMDTCSFIERYSVYNWVEEKRSLFWGNLNLTPAGKVYRDFKALAAFDRSKEVVPEWTLRTAPELSVAYVGNKCFRLDWSDVNIEQTDGYAVERSVDASPFERIATLPFRTSSWVDDKAPLSATDYRVVQIIGDADGFTSNSAGYGAVDAMHPEYIIGRTVVGKGLRDYILPQGFASDPVLVLGAQTHCMKSPMLLAASHADTDVASFGARSWNYNVSDVFVSRDTVSYMLFARPGCYKLGGLDAQAGKIDAVDNRRLHVEFEKPFTSVPAVFATVVSGESSYPAIAQVCSVSSEGFDVELRYEKAAATSLPQAVHFVAVERGSATVAGCEMSVGLEADASLGIYPSKAIDIDYGRRVPCAAFFAAMQSSSDDATAVIRASCVSGVSAKIFKDCETSVSPASPSVEDVAWSVFSLPEENSSIISVNGKTRLVFDSSAKAVYRSDHADMSGVSLVNMAGQCAASDDGAFISTASLAPGLWLASAPGFAYPLKFIVK